MDWTATDEIKKDPELDLSILSTDMCEDDEEHDENFENEENGESQSESSYGSSPMYQENAPETEATAAQAADSTNISRTDPLCTVSTTPLFTATVAGANIADNSRPYVVAYLPTAPNHPIHIRSEQESMMTPQANCVSISNHPAQTIYAEPQPPPPQNATTSPLDAKYAMNNQRIITVPVSTGATTIVNYFLMDLAVQMERLTDIAQMELKIEIHRLLLEKLKNANNLRQAQASICFTTPQNPN